MTEPMAGAGYARAELSALPALQDAPELYAPAPAQDDAMTRADARRDADFALRAAAGATELAGRLQDAPPNRTEGLASELLQRFDEESAALVEDAPSPAAEDEARAAIGRARGRLLDWALPQEAAAQTVARRQGLIDALAQLRAAAERQPEDADALHAEGAAAIREAADWLGDQDAAKLGRQWGPALYEGSLAALVHREPEEAKRQILDGRYGMLDILRRNAWMQKASARSDALAADNLQAQRQDIDRRDLERESNRWKFHADFLKSLRAGTARRRTLDDAEQSGLITSFERQRLEPKLIENELANREERDDAAHVTEFLDGRSVVQPTVKNITAHYKLVMDEVLKQTPSEDRGRLFLDYLRGLGRHDVSFQTGEVETGLPPPVDEPVNPQDIYRMLDYDPTRGEVSRALEEPEQGRLASLSALEAARFTEQLFSGLPSHNNPADAFRHAYWNFLLTRGMTTLGKDGPKNAQKFTDAHEAEHFKETLFGWLPESQTGVRHWPEGERLMDLYNNAVGRALAQLPQNAHRPAHEVILQALEEGKLQTVPMKIKPILE